MIILSNATDQTVQPGQAITFTTTILETCNGPERHRNNTPAVNLRKNGIYEVHFSANVSGATAAAPAQLSIATDGYALPETTMLSASTGFNNVATTTAFKNCCGDSNTVTVVNNGTVAITVRTPNLFVKRIA